MSKKRFGMLIDLRRCIGCHTCSLACKAEYEVPLGCYRTWVKQIEKGRFPLVRKVFLPIFLLLIFLTRDAWSPFLNGLNMNFFVLIMVICFYLSKRYAPGNLSVDINDEINLFFFLFFIQLKVVIDPGIGIT